MQHAACDGHTMLTLIKHLQGEIDFGVGSGELGRGFHLFSFKIFSSFTNLPFFIFIFQIMGPPLGMLTLMNLFNMPSLILSSGMFPWFPRFFFSFFLFLFVVNLILTFIVV